MIVISFIYFLDTGRRIRRLGNAPWINLEEPDMPAQAQHIDFTTRPKKLRDRPAYPDGRITVMQKLPLRPSPSYTRGDVGLR